MLRKSRYIWRRTVLVVENTKMRFFVGDFFGKESGSLHDRSRSGRFWCALLFLLKMFGNIAECGCRLSENFFVYKNPIRTRHAKHADRSFVSQLFESGDSQTQVHSASCQTLSLETRLWASARLRIIIWIGWYLLTVEERDAVIAGTQLGGTFLDGRKSLLKRFRLGRQGKGSVIPFQHRYVLFAVKVSRMELVAIYNTSGTDNWLSNRRKCRNSPFWSKERDGIVLKKYGGAGRGCTKEDSVLFSSSILCWSVFVSKMTKMSENPRRSFL